MFQTVVELLNLLLKRTAAGRIDWEYLADDNMVRAQVGRGLVRLGSEGVEKLEHVDGRTLEHPQVYHVWVIDDMGRLCDKFIITPLEPSAYQVAEQLFTAAKSSARNTEQVLSEMIEALK